MASSSVGRRRQDARHYDGKRRQDVHHYNGKHRQDAHHYKKVKLYPVRPYLPRAERFRWDTKGSAVTSKLITAPYALHSRVYYPTGVVQAVNDDSSDGVGGQVALKTFVSNKEWKRLVATGQNATFPYARTGGFVKPVEYHGTGVTTNPAIIGWKCTFWGQFNGPACVVQNDTSALVNAALGRLKNKLNGYVGKAQLAAPLAEAREIHRLVRQINGFGLDAVKALLLLKKSKGKSVLKLASQIWLGFGFGINPMLKDIESAANAILDYQERQDRGVRVSGSANADYFSTGLGSAPVELCPATTATRVLASASHKQGVRIVAGINLTVKSDASYSVLDHLGLSITDMPSAAWELVPFSWVVDYFTTVSPWLDDVFYTLPGQCKYVSQTTKYQNEVIWRLRTFADGNWSTNVQSKPGGFRYFSFQRISLATLPTRGLRVKSLDEIAKGSLTKLLNLSAVLSNTLVSPRV